MVTYYLLPSDTLTPNGVLSAGYSSMKLLMGTVSLRNHCLLCQLHEFLHHCQISVRWSGHFFLHSFNMLPASLCCVAFWHFKYFFYAPFFRLWFFFSPMSLLWFLAVDVSTPFCPVFLRFLNRFLNARHNQSMTSMSSMKSMSNQ